MQWISSNLYARSRVLCLLVVSLQIFPITEAIAEDQQITLNQLFENAVGKENKKIGTAVAAIYRGDVLIKATSGYANLEHNVEVTNATQFHWASVSKQFTGLAIANLLRENKIRLSDDISKYLPEVSHFDYSISVEDLIFHKSGLREWSTSLQTAGFDSAYTNADVLRMVTKQTKLNFEPGSEFSYNNTGYTLLSIIVERVTGESFNDYMQAHFFTPLKMQTTVFREDPDTVIRNRANAYTLEKSTVKRAVDELAVTGAAGLYSSIDDMIRWATYIAGIKRTDPELYSIITREGALNNGHTVPYGFGFWRDHLYGTLRIDHTGSWAGFKAYTLYFPEHDFALIGVRNFDESIWEVQAPLLRHILVLNDILKNVPGEHGSAGTSYKDYEPADFPFLSGVYKADGLRYLTIVQRENGYVASVFPERWGATTSSSEAALTLQDDARFLAASLDLRFDPLVNEPDTLLLDDMNSGTLYFHRVSEHESPLCSLVGTYYSDELNMAFDVSLSDGTLIMTNVSTDPVTLNRIVGNDFDGNNKIADFVVFKKDSDGRINALEISTERSRFQEFLRINRSNNTVAGTVKEQECPVN